MLEDAKHRALLERLRDCVNEILEKGYGRGRGEALDDALNDLGYSSVPIGILIESGARKVRG